MLTRWRSCRRMELSASSPESSHRVGPERSMVTTLEALQPDERLVALHRHHAANPHLQTVTDPLFVSGNTFFDPRDLVQVKYEMLHRVQEGQSVTQAVSRFGFSRPTFYQARAALERGGCSRSYPSGLAHGERTSSPSKSSASSSRLGQRNRPSRRSNWRASSWSASRWPCIPGASSGPWRGCRFRATRAVGIRRQAVRVHPPASTLSICVGSTKSSGSRHWAGESLMGGGHAVRNCLCVGECRIGSWRWCSPRKDGLKPTESRDQGTGARPDSWSTTSDQR